MAEQTAATEEYALSLDAQDPISHLRNEFIIPTRADLKRRTVREADISNDGSGTPCTYLCGNSLGLQPKRTSEYIQKYLSTWASKGVYGHYAPLEDAVSPPWVDVDEAGKDQMAKIVGALPAEVAVMETLTANLHFLMASFYRPTAHRYKIIIESKAFPSDHFAALSQLQHHNLPSSALVTIELPDQSAPYLSTSYILDVITKHATETALLLLPGIQFYSGQFFDIPTITAHAHSFGIVVGWDLAHAVGNVPLHLHDWNVDFAAWCNYKYMNAGPGTIGGLFVHESHGRVESAPEDEEALIYRPRLSGWWGSDKSSRFQMDNVFMPIAGAAGFQVSNPSVLDTTALLASLSVFALTDMQTLREKSLKLTSYLEDLLCHSSLSENGTFVSIPWSETSGNPPYTIITPTNPSERGAQLSIKLQPGMLDSVLQTLEDNGVVVDERKPDVVRVAPAPLYNTFLDVWNFVQVFQVACQHAVTTLQTGIA